MESYLLLTENGLRVDQDYGILRESDFVSLLSWVFKRRMVLHAMHRSCIKNDTKGIIRKQDGMEAEEGHFDVEVARIDGTLLEIKDMLEEVLDGGLPCACQREGVCPGGKHLLPSDA